MRGLLSFAAVLSTAFAQSFLQPAPESAVHPILNGTAEYDALFRYSPSAAPTAPYGNTDFSDKFPEELVSRSPYSPRNLFRRAACGGPTPGNPANFWRTQVAHGISPFHGDKSYQVWRDVKAYGAKGNGIDDDSGAFRFAISEAWNRNTNYQQTAVPAMVYVPAGTYKISSSIQMLVQTMLVGDPLNMPTLKADASLGNRPLIEGFDQSRGLQSTTNFWIGIRNIKLDTTAVNANTAAVALNWPVSQACQLTNVEFIMPNFSQHVGLTMRGGGSGTIMQDLTFTGGSIGIRLENQQYAFKNIKFNGCNTAIAISHVFVLAAQGLSFNNCGTGIDMGGNGAAGSVSLIDSSADAVGTVISAYKSGSGQGSLSIENFVSSNSGPTVRQSNGGQTLVAGSVPNTWVMGNANPGNYQGGTGYTTSRAAALLGSDGRYFTMKQPQYEKYEASQFANIKDQGVKGDGSADDTAAINAALLANANCKITYFPQGVYLVSDTIFIPTGSRIVGEVWSTISAIGAKFRDANNPRVMLKVGNPGDVGVAQITDMLFTVAEVLPGAILMEINMAGGAKGDVGIWNSHFRIGGSVDSKTNTACTNPNASSCKAAFLMLHIRATGSPYIENMWGWTADHSLDGGPQQVIATGRGVLVEGRKATWLVGTSFEHNALYQYNIVNALNVYIGLQQTETAYWQGPGSPISGPSPWEVNYAYTDPDFSGCPGEDSRCRMGWAQRIVGGSNIYIYGSGFWVFFNGLTFAPGHGYGGGGGCEASCCQSGICQWNAAEVYNGPTKLYWYAVNTHSFTNLILDGTNVLPQQNNPGSWGGVVAAYLAHSG